MKLKRFRLFPSTQAATWADVSTATEEIDLRDAWHGADERKFEVHRPSPTLPFVTITSTEEIQPAQIEEVIEFFSLPKNVVVEKRPKLTPYLYSVNIRSLDVTYENLQAVNGQRSITYETNKTTKQ